MDTELKRHRRASAEIVLRNYPDASAAHNTRIDGIEEWWILNDANGDVLSDVGVGFPTEQAAWDNALFELTRLNALLNWRASGSPEFNNAITFANWIDAKLNLEDVHHIPTPPGPQE